jgi:hypothetical protein
MRSQESQVGATVIAYSVVTGKLMHMHTQDLSLEIIREVFSKNLTRMQFYR